MKSQARVVVIGGGIAGVSTLYHLTQEGWSDVVLIERDDLTTGSTWHAAGQVARFGMNQTQIALKDWSHKLYKELAADPDYPLDYHVTGGVRLAYTDDEVDSYRHGIDMARGMGVEMEFISADEMGRRHPLITTDRIKGAWWDDADGYIDPTQLTLALARRARLAGAKIYRQTPATAITRLASGGFTVHTPEGDITCEKIVNATGYRVNEVGGMLGIRHPVTSMEHMYFLTEPIVQIAEMDTRLPILRCTEADFYARQEKHGLLVGIYEQDCKTFGMGGIDPAFTRDLCPSDLDRCLPNVEQVFERMPVLVEAGVQSIICGPIPYTIDGAPLIGPVAGVPGYFAALGLRLGIGEGGGLGRALAQMIVHGECEYDTWGIDPRRFTGYATTELTCVKAIEDYRHEFHLHLPHEYRPAGRPMRTSPLYAALQAHDPVWGIVNSWERVMMFKPSPDFVDRPSWRFTETEAVVAQEVKGITEGVGMVEITGFNRLEIKGAGAAEFLDRMICGRIPRKVGRVGLCYLLTPKGSILTEATLTKLGEDHFIYGAAAATEWHDRDWLRDHAPDGVAITEMVDSHSILVVAGPKARALLQSVSPRGDWSADGFPWLHGRRMFVGVHEVLALSVSYSGEQAFELHINNAQLFAVWQTVMQAGEAFGLIQFGAYAMESMRLEKGYMHWKAELITERDPFEAGLDRFVTLDKPDFIGKNALVARMGAEGRKRLAVMTVDTQAAPPHAGGSILSAEGQVIGSVTSGGYGHRVGQNIAYGFIPPDLAAEDTELSVCVLGEPCAARVVAPCLFDPDNTRVRR